MSMWNLNSDGVKAVKKKWYKKWPDPTKNWAKDMKILACQHTFQARVDFFALGAMTFFWNTAVPQPNEIIRKTVTGSYKCGFYFGMRFPSPLELFFDPRTVKVIAEMLRPAVTGLWFMWAAGSAWDALSQWQQMMGMIEDCEDLHGECLLKEGIGDLYTQDPEGSPGSYTEIYDPYNLYQSPGGAIVLNIPRGVQMDAWGYFSTGGGTTHWVEIYFIKGGTVPIPGSQVWRAENLGPGSVVEWMLSYSGEQQTGAFSIYIRAEQDHIGLAHSRIQVDRWTMTTWEGPANLPCSGYNPTVLPS